MKGMGPTWVLMLMVAPSTTVATRSTRYGGTTSPTVITNKGAARPSSGNTRSWFADSHSRPRACNAACPTTQQSEAGTHERSPESKIISDTVDASKALTLSVRGGGGGDEDASVLTLIIKLFVPGFGRKKDGDGELDLDGGGLMRRLKRLMSGVLRKVTGSSATADPKGGTAKGRSNKKAKGKGKEAATASHLDKTYRPGNANYRIQKELKEFMTNPPDCCKVSVGKNIRVWIITIVGAEGTIYAGEKFRLRVSFPEDYPTKPPAVYFLQSPPPPKHQHIYTNGDICLSLLSARDWKPNLTVMSLALSILSMLSSAKEKRSPEDNATHAEARPGQAQSWIYHDDLC